MDISSTTATNAALLVQRLVIQKPLRTFWDALPLSPHLIQKPLRTFWDALPLPAIDRSKLVEAQSEKHAHANSLFTCE